MSVIAALLVSWKMTVDNVSRLRLIQVPSADLWPVVPALALSAMWAGVYHHQFHTRFKTECETGGHNRYCGDNYIGTILNKADHFGYRTPWLRAYAGLQ